MLTRSGAERAVGSLDRAWLAQRRWFAGKHRPVDGVLLVDAAEVPGSGGGLLVVVDVVQGDEETRYALPCRLEPDGALREVEPADALWPALAAVLDGGATLDGLSGSFVAVPGPEGAWTDGPGRALSDDQSNTSILLEERLVIKCYRRLEEGVHPEPELLAGLTAVASTRAPRFAGALVRHDDAGESTVACAYAYVPGEPVGWEPLIERLQRALSDEDARALARLAAEAGALGGAAGELHCDLAAAFGTAPATAADAAALHAEGLGRLGRAVEVAPTGTRSLLAAEHGRVAEILDDLLALEGTTLIRCHGDLHVGQLVASPRGPVVIDLEGEPGRPLAQRRRRSSHLRDLACLLLSLDHTAAAAARRLGHGTALARALGWSREARRAALDAYASAASPAGLEVDARLLTALELEKELHEVLYAATVLPAWSYAPRIGLAALLERAGAT